MLKKVPSAKIAHPKFSPDKKPRKFTINLTNEEKKVSSKITFYYCIFI